MSQTLHRRQITAELFVINMQGSGWILHSFRAVDENLDGNNREREAVRRNVARAALAVVFLRANEGEGVDKNRGTNRSLRKPSFCSSLPQATYHI